MKRREFITLLGGVAVAWPLAARAQQSEQMRRIGHLRVAPPPERELQALLRALSEHGYTQGRNFVLVPQWGDGNASRVSELAVMLVNAGVDIIVTESTIVTRAAAAVTHSIPIVMVSSADPFVGGLVKNLSRPGGNVTGFTNQSADLVGKTFEILMEMVPGARRLAVIGPRSASSLFAPAQDQAARGLGIELTYIDMPAPEGAGVAMRQAVTIGIRGAVVRGSPFYSPAQRRIIVDGAIEHRLAVMYERRDFVEQGGLASYATDVRDQYHRTGEYVVKILAGANPGDLPIQQPTKFEFVFNLKTAKTLGLEVPATLLARADEVIE